MMLHRIESRRLALLDLDGVICDDRHRVEHALARNWGVYFGMMVDDTPWRQGRELYESCILTGWDVAWCTGRREDTRDWTADWLKRHGYDEHPLIMRPQESKVPLADLKAQVVEQLVSMGKEVILYDDDPEVFARVSTVPGAKARHCTWHIKPRRLVKKALS